MSEKKRSSKPAPPAGLIDRLRRASGGQKIAAGAMAVVLALGGFAVFSGALSEPAIEVAGDDELFPDLEGLGDSGFESNPADSAAGAAAAAAPLQPEATSAPVPVAASYPTLISPEGMPASATTQIQPVNFEQPTVTANTPAWLTGTIEPVDESGASPSGPVLAAPAGPRLQ